MNKEEINKLAETAKERTDLSDVYNYTVLNDHCIVAPVVFEQKDESGLVKPNQYEDKNEYGVVLAAGPGRYTESGMQIPRSFAVGDTVMYGPYSYTKLRVSGVDLNLIRHDDIIAVLPKS